MIVVRGQVSTGSSMSMKDEYFEFEDGTTDNFINDYVNEWANCLVEIGWEKVENTCDFCGVEKIWGFCENVNCWEIRKEVLE